MTWVDFINTRKHPSASITIFSYQSLVTGNFLSFFLESKYGVTNVSQELYATRSEDKERVFFLVLCTLASAIVRAPLRVQKHQNTVCVYWVWPLTEPNVYLSSRKTKLRRAMLPLKKTLHKQNYRFTLCGSHLVL